MNRPTVPVEQLAALEVVRRSGTTNMLHQTGVVEHLQLLLPPAAEFWSSMPRGEYFGGVMFGFDTVEDADLDALADELIQRLLQVG